MAKYCSNCGTKVAPNTQFCPKCGHQLTNSEIRPRSQRTILQSQSAKHPHWIWWLLLLVVLVAGVGIYLATSNQDSAVLSSSTSETATSSSNLSSSSLVNSSSASSTYETSNALTTNIGPKETAAAIIYYAAQSGVSHWTGVLNTSEGVTIKLSTDEDLLNSLTVPGQGMVYRVYGYHNVDSDDNTDFVYTIDKDDTVNLYTLPNDYDSDDTYRPIASVSKADLVTYLNNHHQGSAVQALKDKVIIDR